MGEGGERGKWGNDGGREGDSDKGVRRGNVGNLSRKGS